MKLKDYMTIKNKPESILYRKYEDFVDDMATTNNHNSYKNDYDLKIKKKKKNKKSKKEKNNDPPLKSRKKIVQNIDYYSKYGNRLDYYQ